MRYAELIKTANGAQYGAAGMLAVARMMQLAQMQKQRQYQYMAKSLGMTDAAAVRNRLGLAQGLSVLVAGLGGAALGGAIGAVASENGKTGEGLTLGGIAGGGLGLLTGAVGNGIGNLAGSLTASSKKALVHNLRDLSLADYLLPGRASYLNAQLNNQWLQNESSKNKPQQIVY